MSWSERTWQVFPPTLHLTFSGSTARREYPMHDNPRSPCGSGGQSREKNKSLIYEESWHPQAAGAAFSRLSVVMPSPKPPYWQTLASLQQRHCRAITCATTSLSLSTLPPAVVLLQGNAEIFQPQDIYCPHDTIQLVHIDMNS